MMDYDTLYRAFEAERKLRIATQEALWAAEQERNAARAWGRAWKRAAKEYRGAARLAKAAWRKCHSTRRTYQRRAAEYEYALERLWVGAEQQSQSHVDVAIACRLALGAEPSEIDVLMAALDSLPPIFGRRSWREPD